MTSEPSDDARRQLLLRYDLGASTADAYFQVGFSVVVQDLILGVDLPRYVRAIRARPLIVVVLAPDPGSVARREEGRGKAAYGPGRPGIAELDAALRRDTPRIGLWLDTSDEAPEQTVERIVARGLAEGRVD